MTVPLATLTYALTTYSMEEEKNEKVPQYYYTDVAENTKFNSCVLIPSLGKEGQYVEPLKLGLFGKKVAFFQIYPLYQEELEFKLDHSFDELIDKIEADGEITDRKLIIDIHRRNYCK